MKVAVRATENSRYANFCVVIKSLTYPFGSIIDVTSIILLNTTVGLNDRSRFHYRGISAAISSMLFAYVDVEEVG